MRRRAVTAAVAALLLAVSPIPASAADPPSCHGFPATIWGTNGPDELIGTGGRDVIVGFGGDDTISGRGGDDVLCGNGGNDLIEAGQGDDVVYAGPGDDTVRGGRGRDVLNGGGGADALRGGADDDEIRGGPGGDAIDGGSGLDRLNGGGGDDFLLGGAGDDRLFGGGGDDVLSGRTGRDPGSAGAGTDFCSGLAFAGACEIIDPTLWDWLRSPPADSLSSQMQTLTVLQAGCDSQFELEWAAVAAATFPQPARRQLVDAVADLRTASVHCAGDPTAWSGSLREALQHLEDFIALVTGDSAEAVGPFGTPAAATPAASDVTQAFRAYMIGGDPPRPERDFWLGPLHGGHARNLAAAAPAGGYEILMIGSSTMASAGVPELLTALDGRTSYNAGIPGTGPEVQTAWLLEQAIRLADPELVVIGVEDGSFRPWDVVPGSCLAGTADWDEAAALRASAFAPVAGLGVSGESLFFGEPVLTSPTRPLRGHDYFVSRYGPLGNRDVFPPSLTYAEKQELVKAILPWSTDYEPCDERIDVVGTLVAKLIGDGIDVVVVAMPISDIRAGAFDPAGGGDEGAGRAVIGAALAEVETAVISAGGTFVDLSDHPSLPEARFRDIHHVDEEGAEIFTTLLAGALAG